MVRIGFATDKGGLDDAIGDRFGRANTFTIVEIEDSSGSVGEVKVVRNPGAEAGSGAGVKAAQTLADNDVEVYVGPNPGPNAYAALTQLGIKIIVLTGVTVREALKKVQEQLEQES